MWVIIAAVVGVTVLLYDQLDKGGAGSDQVVSGPVDEAPDSTAPDTGGGTTLVPGPGQVRVTGKVTAVQLTDAVLQPREVPTPLTVVSERGFGNGGELTNVEVAGQTASVEWDGGRPFVLSAGGGLVIDPVRVDLAPDGLHLVLGGGNHAFVAGPYQLDTPVAVGTSGVATPHDTLSFVASEASLLEARGDASLVFPADAPHHFVGPGTVMLEGELQVTGPDGPTTLPSVTSGVAAFDLTLTPDGQGGWLVDGLIDQAGALPGG
jgi:hypothetical protein